MKKAFVELNGRRYRAVLEPYPYGFIVTFPDVPNCVSSGQDQVHALSNGREMLLAHLELHREGSRQEPPVAYIPNRPVGEIDPAAPVRAFKHVERDFADAFASGESFQVGAFSYYREMEGERGDPLEGSVVSEIRNFQAAQPTNSEMARLAAAGLFVLPGSSNISVRQTTTVHRLPDRYMFCASEKPDISLGQDIFEITNTAEFALALTEAMPNVLRGPVIGRVVYRERTIDVMTGQPESPNSFIKGPRFQSENEVRILWCDTHASEKYLRFPAPQALKFIRKWQG